MAKCLVSAAAVFAVVAMTGGPAAATPVTYTFQATLVAVAPDTLDLDGATLTAVADADTTDAPLVSNMYGDARDAYFAAVRTLTFSDRPNGAPDVTVPWPTFFGLGIQDVDPGSPYTQNDQVLIGSGYVTIFGTEVFVPSLYFDFGTKSYHPGDWPPHLPIVEPSDIKALLADGGILTADHHTALYTFLLPEPGAGALLMMGFLGLAVWWRRRA
jgi:hypothetical protein